MAYSLKKNHGYLWLEVVEYGFISVLNSLLVFGFSTEGIISFQKLKYIVIGTTLLGIEVMLLKLYFFPLLNRFNTIIRLLLKLVITNIYIFLFLFIYISIVIY